MQWREFQPDRDRDAVTRIWREAGWIEDSDRHRAGVHAFFATGHGLVAPVEGEVEACTHWSPGTYRWLDHDLPLCAITAVLTGRLGRRQGLASALVAEALAAGAESGAAVASLGMFEQGYYNRFGFGTGAYAHAMSCDPASLRVEAPERDPVRVDPADHAEVRDLLARRHRGHGSVVLHPERWMEAELAWLEDPWGLGFRAEDGRLTHVMLGQAEGEHGPYTVEWMAYEEPHQVLELLGLLATLADQVQEVRFTFEPAELQLLDLIDAPMRQQRGYRMSDHARAMHTAYAWQQTRILDVERCLALVEWRGEPLELDLELTDPLAARGGRWAGIGGSYAVRFERRSRATAGAAEDGRPVVRASINALSRLWSGARTATGLALTDDLEAPADVLATLDQVFRLPLPNSGLHF